MSAHDYSPLKAALEKLTIFDVWQRLGLEGKPGKTCRSPFRNDRNPSFSIYRMAGDGMISPPARTAMRRTFAPKRETHQRRRGRGC